jgi:putative oxidoreductase
MKWTENLSLLFLRIAFGGFMLIEHGWGKMTRLLDGPPYSFGDPLGLGTGPSLGLAVFAEFLCAGMLILGLLTRWVSIPLIITMAVAAFVVHGADPLGDKEPALLYMTAYLVLLLKGGGAISLDKVFRL